MHTVIFRIVEHFEFIVVCVAKKLCGHSALVAGNDVIIVSRPNFQAIWMPRWNVPHHLLGIIRCTSEND